MRYLIVFLIFSSSMAWAQKPKAPFSNPNYDSDDPSNNVVYEATVTVPRNGKLVIPFTPFPLEHPPSCIFEGGTIPGQRPIVTKNYASIQAKRGAKMHYRCEGVRAKGT